MGFFSKLFSPGNDNAKFAKPDNTWTDFSLDDIMLNLVISVPPKTEVFIHGSSAYIKLGEHVGMSLNQEKGDIAGDKKWIIDHHRSNIVYHIDTETELFYSCDDNTAPKGFTASNSFSVTKNINGVPFSVYVDGVTINDEATKDIHNLSLNQAKLLFGIWRTLRLK